MDINKILQELDFNDIDQVVIDQFYKLRVYSEITLYLTCLLVLLLVVVILWFNHRFKKLEGLLELCLNKKKEN